MNFRGYFSFIVFGLFISGMAEAKSWTPIAKAGFTLKNIGFGCDFKISTKDTSNIVNPCNTAMDSCDSIQEWIWNFGDGTGSNLQEPTHLYRKNGYFTITLKIRTKYGSTDSANRYIYISGPQSAFKVLTDTILELGDTAKFENTSLNPFYNPNWIWSFGDGDIRSNTFMQNEVHVYPRPGKYEVYLTLFDNINGTSLRCSSTYPDTTSTQWNKITITVKESIKISNPNLSKLFISPNPSNHYISIKGVDNGNVIIYNLLGKIVLMDRLNTRELVDISSLSNGLYVVDFYTSGKHIFRKFLKK